MDKKNDRDINIEELSEDELLDFVDKSNTYFIKDDKSGVIGNKKTGEMIDSRTGRAFSNLVNNGSVYVKNNDKYDFLDYKKSIELLNSLDNSVNQDNREEVKEVPKKPTISKNHFLLKKYLDTQIKNKKIKLNKDDDVSKVSEIDDSTKPLEDNEDVIQESQLVSEDISSVDDVNLHNEDLNEKSSEDSELISEGVNSDEELLAKINSRFNNVQEEISDNNTSTNEYTGDFNFTSFEDSIAKEEEIKVKQEEDKKPKEDSLSKFRTLMDFEDYLLIMEDDEKILKSPFDDTELSDTKPKALLEQKEDNDDSFTPFDTVFEVEEIESYDDINNENMVEDGILSDFNLNQSISKKVSIREVIKNKQKKKQEQKELQEKLFFETLDERIEQFKTFKENNIDSQDILNSINMDLNKINSSIKIEFQDLSKKRKARSKAKASKKRVNTSPNKEDKFSLQSLLEEIYEEKGEEPKSLDTNELDIDTVKKDLANKENTKHIVN